MAVCLGGIRSARFAPNLTCSRRPLGLPRQLESQTSTPGSKTLHQVLPEGDPGPRPSQSKALQVHCTRPRAGLTSIICKMKTEFTFLHPASGGGQWEPGRHARGTGQRTTEQESGRFKVQLLQLTKCGPLGSRVTSQSLRFLQTLTRR